MSIFKGSKVALTIPFKDNLEINYNLENKTDSIVISSTGSNNTNHAIMMSKKTQKSKTDDLIVVTPYYNKTTQKGLKKHYEAISKSVDIPILMYNVPSRISCNINQQTAINIVKKQ